jgi:formylglycine-generating enzyme required for sulfatase activity
MEFVEIGSPGNEADTQPIPNLAGAVSYTYQIGKYEVSEDMITKFNATQGLTIIIDNRGMNKPATGVSWNEAARFVNWLNTSSGGFPAYKFTTSGVNDNIALWTASDTLDYDVSNPFRSLRANYVLPDTNEWYKAAYFNPATSTYYDYPYGSDSAPTAVASGTDADTAVYNAQSGPAVINSAGGLSPFGVMGLGGNVAEWEETEYDYLNDSISSFRGIRGGSYFESGFATLTSESRALGDPSVEAFNLGFRVVSLSPVPEPSTWTLFGILMFSLFGWAVKAKRVPCGQ